MVRFNILLTSLLISITAGFSQGDDDLWTLQECIDTALKNNITVKRSGLNILQNQASYEQSKAALAPSLNGRATHVYNFGQNVNPVTNLITDLDSRTNTFGLAANVTLFNGFSNYNTIKQNRFLVDASLADLEQAKNDVGLFVAQAYLQIIFNQELLDAAVLQLESTKEQMRRTKILYDNGAVPEQDYLQAVAQNATNQLSVTNRKNDLNLSKLDLMQLLQIPYNPEFDIVRPELEVDSQTPVTLNSSTLYETALQTQPVIEAAENRIEASEVGIAVAKGNRLPSISAFVGVDTRYNNQNVAFDFGEQLDNNLGQNVGFNLNVPIFNNFQVKQAIQNARINADRAELNNLEVQNNLRQDVEQAYLNAQAALEAYTSSQQQVEALRLSFENVQKQQAAGAVNYTDFTVIQNDYNRAVSDMIRAKFDYIFRLKILDFYQGKPLEF